MRGICATDTPHNGQYSCCRMGSSFQAGPGPSGKDNFTPLPFALSLSLGANEGRRPQSYTGG